MDIRSFLLRNYFWANDFIHGSPIGKHFNDIAYIIKRKKNYAQRRDDALRNILMYAVSHTKFYSECDPCLLKSFPVTTKSILRERYSDIVVDKDAIPGQNGNVFIQKTSGSTGTPFSVPQDTNKRLRRIAELKYFGKESGFNSHDKLVHLRTWNQWQAKTQKQIFWENIIPFGITKMDEDNLAELTSIINKQKVTAVRGYASSIDQLLRYAHKKNIALPTVKLMIAGSEALLESTREQAIALGSNIISQYANEENGILGQELPQKPANLFYLNDASYFFEILELDSDREAKSGEFGRIVITDLYNYAFPMIRYDTGDVGAIAEQDGRAVLTTLYGRRMDLVYSTVGDVVSPMSFARIFKHYDFIVQWQFIQHAESSYEVRLIVDESKEKKIDEMINLLHEVLGVNADLKMTFTDEIPLLDSRKRKPVVNLWKQ